MTTYKNAAQPFKAVECHLNESKFDGVVAFGYILIDGALRVNVTVREHNGKIFPCFPQQAKKDGTYQDMIYPISATARAQIMAAIESAVNAMK